MRNKTYYVGLDVHKETIAIAHTCEGSRDEAVYHGTCGGSNFAAERALRSLAKKLGVNVKGLAPATDGAPSIVDLGL